jgi:hypothetical protein
MSPRYTCIISLNQMTPVTGVAVNITMYYNSFRAVAVEGVHSPLDRLT